MSGAFRKFVSMQMLAFGTLEKKERFCRAFAKTWASAVLLGTGKAQIFALYSEWNQRNTLAGRIVTITGDRGHGEIVRNNSGFICSWLGGLRCDFETAPKFQGLLSDLTGKTTITSQLETDYQDVGEKDYVGRHSGGEDGVLVGYGRVTEITFF